MNLRRNVTGRTRASQGCWMAKRRPHLSTRDHRRRCCSTRTGHHSRIGQTISNIPAILPEDHPAIRCHTLCSNNRREWECHRDHIQTLVDHSEGECDLGSHHGQVSPGT
uniref:(northern house mosquito) hypothetical protein n=1 Tax=Culex pipiens TaxID=7175 RepID=A0A8D7ZZB7_CULPI